MRMLAARSRTELELKERLLEKYRACPDDVGQCIARLKETGLIDDARVAENYAAYRSSVRCVGPSRLARELAARKVPSRIIQQTLSAVYDGLLEEELIDRAIEKRIRTRGHDPGLKGDRRMLQYLARLGFNHDLIVRRVLALRESCDSGDDRIES
jgi:SOS response regulatory protein OraA/RecX